VAILAAAAVNHSFTVLHKYEHVEQSRFEIAFATTFVQASLCRSKQQKVGAKQCKCQPQKPGIRRQQNLGQYPLGHVIKVGMWDLHLHIATVGHGRLLASGRLSGQRAR